MKGEDHILAAQEIGNGIAERLLSDTACDTGLALSALLAAQDIILTAAGIPHHEYFGLVLQNLKPKENNEIA